MWEENFGTQAGVLLIEAVCLIWGQLNTPGGTSYNCLYWEAPPKSGTFSTLQVHKRGFHKLRYKRVGKSVI